MQYSRKSGILAGQNVADGVTWQEHLTVGLRRGALRTVFAPRRVSRCPKYGPRVIKLQFPILFGAPILLHEGVCPNMPAVSPVILPLSQEPPILHSVSPPPPAFTHVDEGINFM